MYRKKKLWKEMTMKWYLYIFKSKVLTLRLESYHQKKKILQKWEKMKVTEDQIEDKIDTDIIVRRPTLKEMLKKSLQYRRKEVPDGNRIYN